MTHQYAGDFNYKVCPAHGAFPPMVITCPQCEILTLQSIPVWHSLEPTTLVVERISPTTILPTQAHKGDLGYDLYSNQPYYFQAGEIKRVSTGIRIKFPEGWGAKIFDRSSVATQQGLVVVAGVIDCGYRGEIQVALHNTSYTQLAHIGQGERIAQMVPMKATEWDIIEGGVDTEETTRGEGGFGSTNES